jgi:4-diphosphocytidyl-2-C-methyl-D-erythritol kinase
MRGRAYAKINLSLRVGSVRPDGYHPIESLVQSIGWFDELTLEGSDADAFVVAGADLPDGDENLAWRAIEVMRAGSAPTVRLALDKRIAVAAGLGGGSADAALGLALGANRFGRSWEDAVEAAPSLGADVPFCLAGGTAVISGVGEHVEPIRGGSDYAVAVIVPPFELATPAVYRRWDELGGPTGSELGRRHLPASLRDHAPLVNDLQPAAAAVEPSLGDWLADTARTWGQPVVMSGSGPALFSLFGTHDEAVGAVAELAGVRAAAAVVPVDRGWVIEDDVRLPPAPWTAPS